MTFTLDTHCCCIPPCPQIFDAYPSPSTIQLDITGNSATNPQTIITSGTQKDELNFDDFSLSATLDYQSSGGCPNSTGSLSSSCEPPYPTSGCCNYYNHTYDDYTINHKYYTLSGGIWVYNAGLSNGRTYPAHKIIQCSIYRYESTGEWWALVKAYIQYTINSYAIMWRGASQISSSLLTSGTYSVTLDLSCAPFNGDDSIYAAPPPAGISWPDGVTAAGTATITVT